MSTTRFPLHLRLSEGHSVYRIESDISFTEVQRVGRRFLVHRVTALTWPERLRIADLLANADGSLVPASAEEFNDWMIKAGPMK
jgi:hypothetical protein